MLCSARPSHSGVSDVLIRKFGSLGVDREEEVQALLLLVKARGCIACGEDIVRIGSSPGYSTVLLNGLACRYRITENGRRQIFIFQYPGDFCDVDRYLLRGTDDAVAALTTCAIGVIRHEDLERVIARYPKLGLALWRTTTIETGILRERFLNVSQRSALPRVANLLCEQIVRLEAIGMDGRVIPMTQIELADAASLSPVHMNRTVRDLRELGLLAKGSRGIEIACRDRLMDIGEFDGRYLGVSQDPLKESPVIDSVTTPSIASTGSRQHTAAANEPIARRHRIFREQHQPRQGESHMPHSECHPPTHYVDD